MYQEKYSGPKYRLIDLFDEGNQINLIDIIENLFSVLYPELSVIAFQSWIFALSMNLFMSYIFYLHSFSIYSLAVKLKTPLSSLNFFLPFILA